MFYFCSTETWLEKWNNDINDPSSLNPGDIGDSSLSLNRYIQTNPGVTLGNALQNWQHIYQFFRLNFQRCITYTNVHVCGYLFSTLVCYEYVCLFLYTYKFACSCVYLAVSTYCLAICLFPMCWLFFLYVYLLNKWFLISDYILQKYTKQDYHYWHIIHDYIQGAMCGIVVLLFHCLTQFQPIEYLCSSQHGTNAQFGSCQVQREARKAVQLFPGPCFHANSAQAHGSMFHLNIHIQCQH